MNAANGAIGAEVVEPLADEMPAVDEGRANRLSGALRDVCGASTLAVLLALESGLGTLDHMAVAMGRNMQAVSSALVKLRRAGLTDYERRGATKFNRITPRGRAFLAMAAAIREGGAP